MYIQLYASLISCNYWYNLPTKKILSCVRNGYNRMFTMLLDKAVLPPSSPGIRQKRMSFPHPSNATIRHVQKGKLNSLFRKFKCSKPTWNYPANYRGGWWHFAKNFWNRQAALSKFNKYVINSLHSVISLLYRSSLPKPVDVKVWSWAEQVEMCLFSWNISNLT